jgi:hypothetical protein
MLFDDYWMPAFAGMTALGQTIANASISTMNSGRDSRAT